MKNLRRKRLGGKTALQTPIVFLENDSEQRRAALVLTAHLGDASYYQNLRKLIQEVRGSVYFEAVRSRDDSEEHWKEPYHQFLRRLREDIYNGIASVGPLVFQGDQLAPLPEWKNADVDCCELAAKLRDAGVSLAPYKLSFALLTRLIDSAKQGDVAARLALEKSLKWGLLAISLPMVFELARRVPRTSALYGVINDWRSERAVADVCPGDGDFVLIYGAAHGDSLLRGLEACGFREVGREWVTVFRA
jgi:hypothetical protein